jgi:hypothetical protein
MHVQTIDIRIVAAAGSDAAAVMHAMRNAVSALEFLPLSAICACGSTGPFGPGIAYELSLSLPQSLNHMLTTVRYAVLWEIETELQRRNLSIPCVEDQPHELPLLFDGVAGCLEISNDAANEIRQYLALDRADRIRI